MSQGELGALPVIIGLVVIWLYFSISEENFLTSGNITNLFLQITAVGIIATGVVLVLLLGEIDLSVGVVSGLAAAIMAVLNTKHGWSGWSSIVFALLVGLAIGLFQGVFITFFQVPTFVVTLAGLLGFQGVLLYVLGDTGDDQPHRQHDRRPGQHVLLGLRRLDHRGRAAGALCAPDIERLPATIGVRARDHALRPRRAPDRWS